MSFKSFKKFFGPGLITGASDDDPSGIATYTQAGAAFGFATLWTALFTIPFMTAVQEASARLALVTRRGLVRNLRSHIPMWLLWIGVLLFVAVNVFNLGADLGLMAVSASTFTGIPQWVCLVFFVAAILALQIFLDYRKYARVLKWLCISLFAYVIVAFTVHVDWVSVVFATFVPQIRFEKEYFLMLVALLGTTISPYLYVWQSSQEVEEDKGDKDSNDEILYHRRVDVSIGMSLSNVVSWFIILTAASVLFANGLHTVSTPAEAAIVLAPIAGKYASWLFTLGVIGTGLLAVPVLSGSAAYALSEAIGLRRFGLSSTWRQAKWFYFIVIALTIAGALTTLLGLNPIRALIYAAVGNALIAPLLILAIIRLTEDKKVMGAMANGPLSRVLLWGAFLIMSASLVIWGLVR